MNLLRFVAGFYAALALILLPATSDRGASMALFIVFVGLVTFIIWTFTLRRHHDDR